MTCFVSASKHAMDGIFRGSLFVVSNRTSAACARLYSERCNLGVPEWCVMAVPGQQPGLFADGVWRATEMDKITVSRAVSGSMGGQGQ